ncbi:MAG: cell wall hydrolase [Gammaproteobacteria bacterium]|nr:MAG: cell wall hydrolase [Gammaproteobacteria bacterium]
MLAEAVMCMAMAIYYEARSEPIEGQMAVAEVILERVEDPRFPDTVCGVVKENRSKKPGMCQFSFYCDGKPERMNDKQARERAFQIAHRYLEMDRPVFEDGSLFYHATYVRPHWSRKFAMTKKIGDHIFYAPPPPRRSTKNIKVLIESPIPKPRPSP